MATKFKTLPNELLPDCWWDENRLNVLFAPFRNKSVNPKDWESKYEFWRNLINAYCLHYKQSFFQIEDLQKAFVKDGRIPACLQDVIWEMLINHDIQHVNDYSNIPSESLVFWTANFIIKKPLIWTFNHLRRSVTRSNNTALHYIHSETIKKIASDLIETVPLKCSKSHVVDIKSVDELSCHYIGGLNILLNYLLIKRKCSLKEISAGNSKITLIKFSESGDKITDRDVDIYTLECTERIISGSIEKYENDIQSVVQDAKNHLIKGRKQMAKAFLKKKKEIERRIESRSNALFNVQTLLLRIEDTEGDSIVLGTYKQALNSLRTTFKNENLNEDAVTNTMLELTEFLDIHDDIQKSLSQPVHEEDVDLEAELADLIAADSKDKSSKPKKEMTLSANVDDLNKQFNDLTLPDVPTHSPLAYLNSDVN